MKGCVWNWGKTKTLFGKRCLLGIVVGQYGKAYNLARNASRTGQHVVLDMEF
jgi:hypothetical protein